MKHFFSFRINVDGPSPPCLSICLRARPLEAELSCPEFFRLPGFAGSYNNPWLPEEAYVSVIVKQKMDQTIWESWIFFCHTSGVCFVPPLREGRCIGSWLILCQNGAQLGPVFIISSKHVDYLFRIQQKGFLQIYIEKSRRWVGLTRI